MHAVVQATRRMPGPSTADPVVNEWRNPRSPVLSAVLTSVSGTRSPRLTRITYGDAASSGTVWSAGGGCEIVCISLSVESAVDDIQLLFTRQPHEVHSVARDANGQARIFLRVVHRVHQGLAVQDVDVHVIAGRAEEAVENGRQIRYPIRLPLTQSAGHERGRQRNAVLRVAVGNLCH